MTSFALVPAAGNSSRMGTNKLLLPWQGKTLIEFVVDTWLASQVSAVVVVTRPQDHAVHSVLRTRDVHVVVPPTAPAEMKDSVRLGLQHVRDKLNPTPESCWLLAPADMPRLSPRLIDAVLDAWPIGRPHEIPHEIIVPTFGGKRGHPVLFPWSLHTSVFALGEQEGVNAVVARGPVIELPLSRDDCLVDVDRPADYRRLTENDRPTDE